MNQPTEFSDVAWEGIKPLSAGDRAIDVSEFDSLSRVWLDARSRLEREEGPALEKFFQQLRRSWSIETGILENLYALDRGTTTTLIDHGFHAELVDRADTDIDPGRLVAMLKDHLAASEMVQTLITEDRPLTPFFLRSLQGCLTRNQPAVEAEDPLGNKVLVEPLRGVFKQLDNYRDLDDGQRLRYCPVEQTEGQVEQLLAWLIQYLDEGVNVCLVAAWLHHRFTLIHPFQDGNGRVARALVNYVFLRSGLFPVVIPREEKDPYIAALRGADEGLLEGLTKILAQKQVVAIKQGLSLEEMQPSLLVKDLARGLLAREERRKELTQEKFRGVNKVAADLQTHAAECLRQQVSEFEADLQGGGFYIRWDIDEGGTFDGREHFYRWQAIDSAQQARQWANFNEESRWVRALVDRSNSRLRFILSFHHVGRNLSGVAEVTSIADLEDLAPPPTEEEQPPRRQINCMVSPFTFTWEDSVEAIGDRFDEWVSGCLVVALRAWADTF